MRVSFLSNLGQLQGTQLFSMEYNHCPAHTHFDAIQITNLHVTSIKSSAGMFPQVTLKACSEIAPGGYFVNTILHTQSPYLNINFDNICFQTILTIG